MKEAKGRDEASLDAVAKAIDRFEEHSKNCDFKNFHVEQARAFKAHLTATRNARTGKPLSASTVHSTLAALRASSSWLAQKRGYRSRLNASDAEYFNAPDNLSRVATARRYKACPTMKQVRAMLDAMPSATDVERRDRALVAFALLSGARDRAIVSFKLKHVDIENELIEQDARDVRTKRGKPSRPGSFPSATTSARSSSIGSRSFARKKASAPKTRSFRNPKSRPAMISSFALSGSIGRIGRTRTRFARFFEKRAPAPGCPISIRIRFGTRWSNWPMNCELDAERFKAWSQNLGHEHCLTTFSSYGEIPPSRQAEIIRGLAASIDEGEDQINPEQLRKLADKLERRAKPS